MGWMEIADNLWRIRFSLIPILALSYAVPILRIITFPFSCGGRVCIKINKWFGFWEEIISPFRNTILLAYLVGGLAWHLWLWSQNTDLWIHPLVSMIAAALIALTLLKRHMKRDAYIWLMEFVERHPTIHPQEFFDRLLSAGGAIRHRIPKKPLRTIDPTDVHFERINRKPTVRIISLIRGIWSTIKLARLALLLDKNLGIDILREVAPAIATVWASRIIQLTRSSITINGLDKIPAGRGILIYLFTHKSFFDFVIAPLVPVALATKRNDVFKLNLPLFLMARDHFRKNIFLYRILGIGRAAEVMGMVFVDRKDKGNKKMADAVTQKVTDKLLKENVDLAIFPQGTRALPYPSIGKQPRDAGYYTVGSRDRIRTEGGHLKKGASYIATDTLIGLGSGKTQRGDLKLIPIAMHGTATACPKGSTIIRTGVRMHMDIGNPIILTPAAAREIGTKKQPGFNGRRAEFALQLHRRIDTALKTTARVHAELERRFFEDLRSMYDTLKIDELAVAMKPWRGNDYLVHAILDNIYSCPPKHWRPLLGELTHQLLNFAERDELLAFKGRVANALPL